MRLFVAVDLSDQTKNELQKIQDPALKVKWTSVSTMHLTLRFIGEVDNKEDQRVLRKHLLSINQRFLSFTLHGLGCFPPRSSPKIIWAGIEQNRELMNMQKKVEIACQSTGFKPEKRTYIPHITIGRVKGASKKEIDSYIDRYKEFEQDDIMVNEFVLYKSELHSGGAIHSALERFELKSEPDNNNE